MPIYSRAGDNGDTSLFGGGKVRKCADVVEVLGQLDELNAFLGSSRLLLDSSEAAYISSIQADLFALGAVVAGFTREKSLAPRLAKRVRSMEKKIDALDKKLPVLNNFILPGGCESAVRLHLARAVCRRCERALVSLNRYSKLIPYLNRLSDYLFALARYENLKNKVSDRRAVFDNLE